MQLYGLDVHYAGGGTASLKEGVFLISGQYGRDKGVPGDLGCFANLGKKVHKFWTFVVVVVACFGFSVLLTEEELSLLMPLPKFRGSCTSTAHHMTHSATSLLLWKDL